MTVVLGPSDCVFEVRRNLRARGLSRFHSSSDLPDLRRRLLQGRRGRVIVCVVLDRSMVGPDDRDLRQFLADLRGLPGASHSIGLVVDGVLDPIIAGLGCDVYAGGTDQASELIRSLLEADGAMSSEAEGFVAVPRLGSGPARDIAVRNVAVRNVTVRKIAVRKLAVRKVGRTRRRTIEAPGALTTRSGHGGHAGFTRHRFPPGGNRDWLYPPHSYRHGEETGDWPDSA